MTAPTHADLLEAIKAAMRDADPEESAAEGVFTTEELAEYTGWSKPKVRKLLRPLVQSGIVEPTRIRRRNFIDDRIQSVSAYRLVEPDSLVEIENKE